MTGFEEWFIRAWAVAFFVCVALLCYGQFARWWNENIAGSGQEDGRHDVP